MTMALRAEVSVRRGGFLLDVALTVAPGETVAVLGPNGSGKSTLLAALAGLIPASGTVVVGERVLTASTAPGSRVAVAPERRRVGLLSQAPLLFPHLSALENVAFGQRAQGRSRAESRRAAGEWLDAVGLGGYEARKPGSLSGGQQQRVAIARALAARPDVLLLDEPLAALDVQTAGEIRRLLAERLAEDGTTTIVVTHDVIDVLTLADRCAILHEGRIIDDGPRSRVLGRPRNQFIAALAGVNLVSGTLDGDAVVLPNGRRLRGRLDGQAIGRGAAASAVFAPAAVHVDAAGDDAGADPGDNSWDATVAGLEPSRGGVRIRTTDDPDLLVDLASADAVDLDLRPGRRIRLTVAVADVTISG